MESILERNPFFLLIHIVGEKKRNQMVHNISDSVLNNLVNVLSGKVVTL